MACSSTSLMTPNCDAIAPAPAVSGFEDDEPDVPSPDCPCKLGSLPPPCSVCRACCAFDKTVCSCSADGSSTLSTIAFHVKREKPLSSNAPDCSFSNSPKPLS